MGIIMERLNNSIPQLQDSISSAFENVSAGIVENAKSYGIAGLDSTFEIFSDSSLILGASNLLPTASETAAYPDPVQSLTKQTGNSVLPILQDQNFKPERELTTLLGPGFDKGSGWLNQLMVRLLSDKLNSDRTIDGQLADGAARKQAKGPISEITPNPPTALFNILGPGGDKGSDWLNQISYGFKMDQSIADQSIDGELADGAARKQAKGSVSEFIPDPPSVVPPDPGFVGTRNLGPIDSQSFPDLLGDVHGANQNFYPFLDPTSPVSEFVPGTPAVEGRASGSTSHTGGVMIPPQKTFLQTIDQTAEQMQINPQPETAQLMQQQFSAIQEMTSTVQETLGLYQQLNFNSVFNMK